jgi:hypothetical protein
VKATAAATAVIVIAIAAPASAHRLDEYLQAARIAFARAHVGVEMDLTPGASVADKVIALLDRDGDGRITEVEAETYGRVVLSDLRVDLEGERIALRLDRVEVPSTEEMRHGLGTIQVRASGDFEPRMSFRRQLHFQNNHQAESSVYLVNALVPVDSGIGVLGQTRDTKQRSVRIDYSVTPEWPRYLYWPLLALFAVGSWWWLERRAQPLVPNP